LKPAKLLFWQVKPGLAQYLYGRLHNNKKEWAS